MEEEQVSYWVRLSETNVVDECIVVEDLQDDDAELSFIHESLGLDGVWVKTYQDGRRKQYASYGYTYDANNDVFVSPQPFPSWSLNAEFDWQPPTPRPDGGAPHYWDEESLSWLVVDIPTD